MWQVIAQTISAHVVMLADTGLIDEDARSTLLNAIENVSGGEPPEVPVAALVTHFDDRLDVQTPAGVSGTARVGRGTSDVVATAIRLFLREKLLTLGDALDTTRRTALALASAHTTTLMPAYIGGQPAQPTNLGHFLGGLIGPFGRVAARLPVVYAEVNRSPLGSGEFASSGMAVDRERAAELLGFDGLIVNTFDAVTTVDHVSAVAELVAGVAATVHRFVTEILFWLRTDPSGFSLAETWTSLVPNLPQVRIPTRLEALVASTVEVGKDLAALRAAERDLPYGPVAWNIDPLVAYIDSAIAQSILHLSEMAELLSGGLVANRAYLANRAGRSHTTTSDLADFLMIEEQLDPGTAQSIAARTTARIIADGVETSGITPEMIDAAALMVIGREVKVEFEAISRYLAPRRFLERRSATGSPSPVSTRAYLDQELFRLGTDERWRTGVRERNTAVENFLNRAIEQAHTHY
jgi:argininosuccinate lyase